MLTAQDRVHTGPGDPSVQSKIRVLGVVPRTPPCEQCRVCGALLRVFMATRTSMQRARAEVFFAFSPAAVFLFADTVTESAVILMAF